MGAKQLNRNKLNQKNRRQVLYVRVVGEVNICMKWNFLTGNWSNCWLFIINVDTKEKAVCVYILCQLSFFADSLGRGGHRYLES